MTTGPIRMRRRTALLAMLAAGVLAAAACGGPPSQTDYPTRDIQVIVPYPAGSSIDTTTRVLAKIINDNGGLGQQRIQVVNKEGGAGSVGATAALNAEPNGYTLGVLPDGPLTLTPHTEEVAYDPGEVSVITEATIAPVMFVVPADSPYRNLGDLIDAATKRTGEITLGEGPLNYAVPATKFERLTNTRFKHVEFDGDQATTTALLGDNLDVGVMQLAGAFAQLKSGKLRALGIASAEPVEIAPDIPTFTAQGVDLEWEAYNLVVTPPRVPTAIAKELSDVFSRAVKSKEFAESAKALGLVVSGADGPAAEKRLTQKSTAAADLLPR